VGTGGQVGSLVGPKGVSNVGIYCHFLRGVYLCVQHVTVCPFRVVDEINQGMDQINERKVIFAALLTPFKTGDHCTGHVICCRVMS
jgi:hypothetical protein